MSNPEHEKLSAVRDKTQFLHDFLEFLSEKGIEVAEWHHDVLSSVGRTRVDGFMYEFIEVDPDKLEEEKRGMLDHCRYLNMLDTMKFNKKDEKKKSKKRKRK